MSDYTKLLERAGERYDAPDLPLEGLLRRQDRQRRNQRVAALGVGLAIGIAAVIIVVRLVTGPSVPAVPQPSRAEHNGSIFLFSDQHTVSPIDEAGNIGPVAYQCEDSCGNAMDGAWSPDGTRLAIATWCLSCNELKDGIRIIDLAAKTDVLIAKGFAGYVNWSPDGKRLAFVKDGGLYTMASDGNDLREVPGAHHHVISPSLLPDGRVVYATYRHLIYVSDLDGSNRQELATGVAVTASPNGSAIAVMDGCNVSTIDADGNRTLIHSLRADLFHGQSERHLDRECRQDLVAITWSPDGQRIGVLIGIRLVVMNADGGNAAVHMLPTTGHLRFNDIAWRPVP